MFRKGMVQAEVGRAVQRDQTQGQRKQRKPQKFKRQWGFKNENQKQNAKNESRSEKVFNKSVTKQTHRSLCTY